jgi:hypothetical protein
MLPMMFPVCVRAAILIAAVIKKSILIIYSILGEPAFNTWAFWIEASRLLLLCILFFIYVIFDIAFELFKSAVCIIGAIQCGVTSAKFRYHCKFQQQEMYGENIPQENVSENSTYSIQTSVSQSMSDPNAMDWNLTPSTASIPANFDKMDVLYNETSVSQSTFDPNAMDWTPSTASSPEKVDEMMDIFYNASKSNFLLPKRADRYAYALRRNAMVADPNAMDVCWPHTSQSQIIYQLPIPCGLVTPKRLNFGHLMECC